MRIFSTVNFRRKKNYERSFCLNNPAQSSSALCAHWDIWQLEQSKDLAQAFIDPSLRTCATSFLSCAPRSSAAIHGRTQVVKSPLTGSIQPISQLPSLKWQAAKTENLFSPGTLKKKPLWEKMLLSRKFHFSYSWGLQLMLSCHPKSCSSFIGVTPHQHLELASELRWLDKLCLTIHLLVCQTTLCLLPLSAKRCCDYYCTKFWSNLASAQGLCKISDWSNFLLRTLHSSSWRTESANLTL